MFTRLPTARGDGNHDVVVNYDIGVRQLWNHGNQDIIVTNATPARGHVKRSNKPTTESV